MFKWESMTPGWSSRVRVTANGVTYIADAYGDGSYSVDCGNGYRHIADEDGRRSIWEAQDAAEAWITAKASQ
jgi:hypothetical protein